MSGSWNPVRILTVGFSGDIYRDEIDGRTIGYDEKKSLVCWDVKGNVNVSITPTTDFQVDASTFPTSLRLKVRSKAVIA